MNIKNDPEFLAELDKAYRYAAPYVARTRFAIAYLQRPELQWSNGHILDTATGEIVLHVQSGFVISELQSKGCVKCATN
jgi:hypothetical protein